MRVRKKIVNGQEYYYLEESIRLEKPRVFSIFLGRRIPDGPKINQFRRSLIDNIYNSLLGQTDLMYLKKEQLIEVEKHRRQYVQRIKSLSKAQKEDKEEIDTVNFVYTTLSTEGVPITKEDAGLAYKFTQKEAKNLRSESLQIALDMIKGLRYVKESKKGADIKFILNLHSIIMAEFTGKNPGNIREKQAYIYLRSYEKVEEIGFRPPIPKAILPKLEELTKWYNANVGKLNAIELAALLHLRFYMIHPFEDGNKRVSRLLTNKAFFDSEYPLLNISKDTQSYFDALIKSVEKKKEEPFVDFVLEQFLKYI